jgi:steroid 5-alpha reductase family enzyme
MTADAAWVGAAGPGLAVNAALAAGTWLASLRVRDVSIVDSVWPLLILAPACVFALVWPHAGPRAAAILVLVIAWALRLFGYIAWRHRGQPEDRRYRAIRARNQPHFDWKSLYLVFGLQAALAWIVALPLMAAVASPVHWMPLDALGIALFLFGLVFETVADAQLARFKADPAQQGRVMARGLWRYSRHPNYFGECCVWWGLWLLALAAGAGWAVASPLLMTLLLLRVAGVTLLEKDMAERRPEYRDYMRRTNAFIPGRPRT